MARECPPGAMRGFLGGGQVDLRMVYHIGTDGALERPRGGHDMAYQEEPVVEVRCTRCGWEGRWSETESVTVHEDYGDVYCHRCPRCGRIEYDGMEMFEEVA